jgi:hypothetical protein
VDHLGRLAHVGVQHAILGIPAHDVEAWIDLVGSRVIPAARGL